MRRIVLACVCWGCSSTTPTEVVEQSLGTTRDAAVIDTSAVTDAAGLNTATSTELPITPQSRGTTSTPDVSARGLLGVLLSRSTTVAQIVVTNASVHGSTADWDLVTDIDIQESAHLSGPLSPPHLTIPGGQQGARAFRVGSFPIVSQGQSYVVFLDQVGTTWVPIEVIRVRSDGTIGIGGQSMSTADLRTSLANIQGAP